MKTSESRILTTHTGSLPRSPELQELLRSRLDPKSGEEAEFRAGVEEGVADVMISLTTRHPAGSVSERANVAKRLSYQSLRTCGILDRYSL